MIERLQKTPPLPYFVMLVSDLLFSKFHPVSNKRGLALVKRLQWR